MRTIISSCMFVGLLLLPAPAFALFCPIGQHQECIGWGTAGGEWHTKCWCTPGVANLHVQHPAATARTKH
jgi:hypothetical protein